MASVRGVRHALTTTSCKRICVTLFVWIVLPLIDGANWAQVSGKRQTNAVVLEITPWARRHGHAVTALDFSDEYVRSTGQKARMFVIGGDTSVQGKEDMRAYPGGGSLKNDVWATTGIHWEVRTNILKTNKWGEPLAQTIANISWLQTNNGKRPPKGVTYHEWIACAANPWAVHPVSGCDDPSQPPGAYLADNMFSPRRNFVAIAFKNELFVLGGRAREHVPVPEDQLRGGALTIGPRNARWREFTVLKNDVWRSSDAGASWKLVTPGCRMPQAELIHKSGSPEFQCETDDDCEGDASCTIEQATSTGYCVCNMWSPREFHAVTVHDGDLYLSGGYALIQLGNCGVEEHARKRPSGEEFPCGGGYRAYMNDVWMSKDGQTWKRLTLHASFAPRGEHAMISFQSMLYVFGGRSGDPLDAESRALHNDIWTSTTGERWAREIEHAPWSPRAKHTVLVLPGATDVSSGEDPMDEILLLYGEDEERTLEDVWTWRGRGSEWIVDYATNTDAAEYVSLTSDVRFLRGIKDSHVEILHAHNLATIEDLTTITFDKTIEMRAVMPICDYIALAKQIVTTCSIHADVNEGDAFANIQVIQGKDGERRAAEAAEAAANAAVQEWDGCAHVGTQVVDTKTERLRWVDVKGIDQVVVLRDIFDDAQSSICRWHPTPRSGHGSTVFQRKVFVVGGLTAPDYYENDVWYRDKRRPMAQLTLVPTSGTSETVFRFESDKPGCTFEYHVLNLVEMLVVRNWTKTMGEVDFLPWLDGGKFRFRVRALDPAGNVDMAFEARRNEYIWIYKPRLPWGLIIGFSCVGVVMMGGMIMEWRKRRKRAAMERYAMKRMRRKVKGTKRTEGNTDANWRETYDQAKDGKKGKKKGKLVGVKKDKKSKDENKTKTKTTTSKDKTKKTTTKDKKADKKKTKTKEDKPKKKTTKDGGESGTVKPKTTKTKDPGSPDKTKKKKK